MEALKTAVDNTAIENLFIKVPDNGKGTYYELNDDFNFEEKLDFQKAAQLLIIAIRYWNNHNIGFFCGNRTTKQNEGEWSFTYKTPSNCGGCVRGQKVLGNFFRSDRAFNNLPFVEYKGDRVYTFSMRYLMCFAEKGEQAVKEMMKADTTKATQIKQENEKEIKRITKENEVIAFKKRFSELPNEEVLENILKYNNNSTLLIVNPDLAVTITERSSYGTSGCIAYYDQLRVFYKNQEGLQELQKRDNNGDWKDRNIFNQVESVEMKDGDGKILITTKVSNKGKSIKTFTVEFESAPSKIVELSESEQSIFLTVVDNGIQQVLKAAQEQWEYKPTYYSSVLGQHTQYRQPTIKEKKIQEKNGVAVFTLEEQIDGTAGRGAQMRNSLFKITHGTQSAVCIDEDHAYEGVRPTILTIVSLDSEKVTYTITEKSEKRVSRF